jgi:hypothetical protein
VEDGGQEEVSPPAVLFLLATVHAGPVGCGMLESRQDAPAHIERMREPASRATRSRRAR